MGLAVPVLRQANNSKAAAAQANSSQIRGIKNQPNKDITYEYLQSLDENTID